MILLHHPESELSRSLLATLPEGCAVVDWTDNAQRAAYTATAYIPPSAFPTVIVDTPAYAHDVPQLGPDGVFMGMTRETAPAHQEALRLPASWEAVESYVAYAQERAVANPPE